MRISVIVDTSALVALARGEPGFRELRAVFADEYGAVPTPVLVEFHRVMARAGNSPDPAALTLIDDLGVLIMPFGSQAAHAAVIANERYGTGNGDGGKLNMLDLMVYAIAKVEDLPILCTGNDFTSTDAIIHPASRRDA